MQKQQTIMGEFSHERVTLSFLEVCSRCRVPEDILRDWIAQGLLGDLSSDYQTISFDELMVSRIHAAYRLHRDLEVNSPGVILALELMDQLAQLQDEVTILRRHVRFQEE